MKTSDASPPIAKSPGASGRELVEHVLTGKAFRQRLESLQSRKQARIWLDEISPAAYGFACGVVLGFAARCEPRPRVWILTPDLRAQESLADDLQTWFGKVFFFPELEQDRSIDGLPDQDVQAERLAILRQLNEPSRDLQAIVLNAASLEEEVPAPQELDQQYVEVKTGDKLPMEKLAAQLTMAGYERDSQVAERGQFAIRGGILDVYSWHAELPVRLEFFDAEIESIRTFDPDAQTSIQREKQAAILLNPGQLLPTCALADCIAPGDWVISVGTEDLPRANVVITGDLAPTARGKKSASTECHDQPVGSFEAGDFVLQEARRDHFTAQLEQWRAEGWRVEMFFNNEGEIERFQELLPQQQALLTCRMGSVKRGFTVPEVKLAVLCDAELFGRYQTSKARRLFAQERRVRGRRTQLDLQEMHLGDLVVHLEYGIGKYRGLIRHVGQDGQEEDVLIIEYAEEAKLYVPLQKAYLVSRYVGLGRGNPQLSKLGDGKWGKTRKNAEASIFDYATELLRIQAERQTGNGFAHAPDTKWQHEFETAFIFKETVDQLRAIEDTKRDMESQKSMDRLICGDVGFGKTEVAIRAIFKAVMSGKQAAFLCPTTVLAQQHFRTLRERFSDYPVKVELLNRFRSAKETKQVLQGMAEGSVDVCVGTHRLISKDVGYKDLGLVVIDEEQRFGVLHKERFKELFRLVDVLTLSATPIPRTLYLSLMGARDMSTIDTPPANRIPVETTVLAYDERVIRKAIDREIHRGGQVYFLHNRVETIERTADRIRDLCPGARVVVGHGQMEEGVLQVVMQEFIDGKADVLVSTTIIESGIDIPNANTIIIDRADRFGLADLYQLRGRVGRAGHKAYAYLMLPSNLLSTTDARKRINAIKQYTSLGSGFKIAMRDLEIRGAGNLLGTQQSGNVVAIGFDLYCQILKQAVHSIQGRPRSGRLDVTADVDFVALTEAEHRQNPHKLAAYVPTDYMEEAATRIAAYKQVAELTSMKELNDLEKNWQDRFGQIPMPATNLLRHAELKISAWHNGIQSVQIKDNKVMLQRKGKYLMIQEKFPRLNPKQSQPKRLLEAIEWVKKL